MEIRTYHITHKINFGKYKGLTIDWIIKNDKQYVDWLLKNKVIKISYKEHKPNKNTKLSNSKQCHKPEYKKAYYHKGLEYINPNVFELEELDWNHPHINSFEESKPLGLSYEWRQLIKLNKDKANHQW